MRPFESTAANNFVSKSLARNTDVLQIVKEVHGDSITHQKVVLESGLNAIFDGDDKDFVQLVVQIKDKLQILSHKAVKEVIKLLRSAHENRQHSLTTAVLAFTEEACKYNGDTLQKELALRGHKLKLNEDTKPTTVVKTEGDIYGDSDYEPSSSVPTNTTPRVVIDLMEDDNDSRATDIAKLKAEHARLQREIDDLDASDGHGATGGRGGSRVDRSLSKKKKRVETKNTEEEEEDPVRTSHDKKKPRHHSRK